MKLTLQQLEAHLWGAANILRGKTAGQDYKNYILSLTFYKRLCDQWEWEADDAIAEQERQQGRTFTEAQKAIFRKRGEHRYAIPDGSRWGDVKAVSVNSPVALHHTATCICRASRVIGSCCACRVFLGVRDNANGIYSACALSSPAVRKTHTRRTARIALHPGDGRALSHEIYATFG